MLEQLGDVNGTMWVALASLAVAIVSLGVAAYFARGSHRLDKEGAARDAARFARETQAELRVDGAEPSKQGDRFIVNVTVRNTGRATAMGATLWLVDGTDNVASEIVALPIEMDAPSHTGCAIHLGSLPAELSVRG